MLNQKCVESSIAKAIKESDADVSISKQIKEAVTKESSRLDKIAELETQLAELKMAEKEDATMDDKAFREAFMSEITEYAKEAEANELVELYNKFSANEVEMNENDFTIKTPETAEIIADAEQKWQTQMQKYSERSGLRKSKTSLTTTGTKKSHTHQRKTVRRKQKTSQTRETRTAKWTC